MITRDEIVENFKGCIHCSQVVANQWADRLGYDQEEICRIAAPFGGGFFQGDTCGAVNGAMIVIGMKYGHCEPGDTVGNSIMIQKVNRFFTVFRKRQGSHICRELCGYDFSKPGELEKAIDAGTLFDKCPEFVLTALEVLDEVM